MRPLMPLALILVVIWLEVFAKLIQRVVSQMSKKIVLRTQVSGIRRSSETSQSILIDIYTKRVPTSDSNIEPHIELKSIRKQRFMDVLTDNVTLLLLLKDLLGRSRQPDTSPLRTIMRFYYVPPLLLQFLGVLHENASFIGEDESVREKVILPWQTVLHF